MTRTRSIRQRAAVRRITLHHAARRAALASGWGRRHRTATHRPNGDRA
ncbi:hypothetical protein HUT16_13395 [Kitasatospora sp. NA04385]|nr:hypothetical protein [Kitasatospora sp. NA04385]QKW19920.1 hypothetical protein HUT16_13395 [Kitasatospora sp. NA04385]